MALSVVAAAATPVAAHAADTPYTVGAAAVSITPPPAGAADPAAFSSATCTALNSGGPRPFAFNEPYLDANHNGQFDYGTAPDPPGDPTGTPPEPYCDANANGRYDGIFSSGRVDALERGVHDPIDARAVAISDGSKTVVVVSVVAQGLFENYTDLMRDRARQLRPGISDVVVSADHNESSPDTIGIYGGPTAPNVPAGVNSGIDDYYMSFLVDRVAQAAVDAYDARRPASLWATKLPIPSNLEVQLSNNFPTTADSTSAPAAIDPRLRVLQARDAAGNPFFTMMSLAAHNQEIGHSGDDTTALNISRDWPGYFEDRLQQLQGGGTGMFLVGANGSEEDPRTVPPAGCDQCHPQAQATGEAFAEAVHAAAAGATELRGGAVSSRRSTLFVPIENNVFKAAAAAGLFGDRQTYTAGVPSGHTGPDLKTHVSVVDVGPDLQFAGNPGEAFPALIYGSPWGIEDVGCRERDNPPAPDWHARAAFRFQVGLADDMIGYEIPAWAFSEIPGVFTSTHYPVPCNNDPNTGLDPAGHKHKLESEGVGPTASNAVAAELTSLLDQEPDPAAHIRLGRYVHDDGSLSRRPEGAVAVWLADPGSTMLTPGHGTIVAIGGRGTFGGRRVDQTGFFMDYDGTRQSAADITTRGMVVGIPACPAAARYYVDVYPHLDTAPLGNAAVGPPGDQGVSACPTGSEAGSGPGATSACRDRTAPRATLRRSGLRLTRRRITLRGRAHDAGCAAGPGTTARAGAVRRVSVSIAKFERHRCRFLRASGTLTARRSCRRTVQLRARGTTGWRLSIAARLPRGFYGVVARAADRAGNRDRRRAGPNALRFRVR